MSIPAKDDFATSSINETPNIQQLPLSEKKNLVELAKNLTYNYFANAFGDHSKEDVAVKHIFHGECKWGADFEKWRKNSERVRNILVVGAGASADMFKGIHTGNFLIKEMQEIYENKIKSIDFLEERFNDEVEEIKELTGRKELSLENYLYLLSKCFVPQKQLREKIKEMTGIQYAPSLFNEIVAHLLKHAFLDVVINFNFEETLDNAIEEEIGKDNYYSVISDGNCADLKDLLVDGRLKIPIYIKPHGSNSHKSTLRFTNRHYFDLPTDIKNMLQELLSGARGDRNKTEIQRVNLIFVGFAMESLEFNKIVNRFLPARSTIYHLDFNVKSKPEEIETFLNNKFPVFFEKAKAKNRTISKGVVSYGEIYRPIGLAGFSQNCGKVSTDTKEKTEQNTEKTKNDSELQNTLTSALGELMSVLWRISYNTFAKAYRPRSIGRHEIISYLFYEPHAGTEDWEKKHGAMHELEMRIRKREYIYEKFERNSDYFLDRTIIEIVLAVNRNNGLIDIIELSRGRVGKYYKLYRSHLPADIEKHTIPSLYDLIYLIVGSPTPGIVPEKFKNSTNIFRLHNSFEKEDFLKDEGPVHDKLERLIMKPLEENINKTFPELPYPCKPEEFYKLKQAFYKKIRTKFTEELDKCFSANGHINEELFVQKTRTITLLGRLFSSRRLSNRFKLNLLSNYEKPVFNGKKPDYDPTGNITMTDELFRLFEKSVGKHYFILNTNPSDAGHHIFESFEKKNLINLNIGLSYEFNNIFFKMQWDILFLISEIGSNLEFLQHIGSEKKRELNKSLKNKQLIIICSYDAVKQLYPRETTKSELAEKHRARICNGILNEKNVTLCFIPFREHNHHQAVFLRKIHKKDHEWDCPSNNLLIIKEAPTKNRQQYGFVCSNSIYMYRDGLSNSMDPLFIGVNEKEVFEKHTIQDQYKLLCLFYTHILRAVSFKGADPDLRFAIATKHTFLETINNTKDYKTWPPGKFIDNLEKFLSQLWMENKSV